MGKSEFFPIVYGAGRCNDTKFFENSAFKEPCSLYSFRVLIRDKFLDTNIEKKKFMLSSRLSKNKKEIINIGRKFTHKINDNDEKIHYKIPSFVLLSEMAWGDLKQFIENYKSSIIENMYNNIIIQVFLGINDLQEKLNVVHNDLHLGNILMLLYEGEKRRNEGEKETYLTCLIHDFGKSEKISIWTSENRIEDYAKFTDALLTKPEVPHSIKSRLFDLYENIIRNYNKTDPPLKYLLTEFNK